MSEENGRRIGPFAAMAVTPRRGTIYPPLLADRVAGRAKRPLGLAAGLEQFGVNLTELVPGAWSALRHWHAREDEFVYVLEGELTLITDDGAFVLGPGDCAGFPAGEANAHHLVNRSAAPARYLEVGTRAADDEVCYAEADLHAVKSAGTWRVTRKDGAPYD